MTHALDVETGELIALPAPVDPLIAELPGAVARVLKAQPGARREALRRYLTGVGAKVVKERDRLYLATYASGRLVGEDGVLLSQWYYLTAHHDNRQAAAWTDQLLANLARYEALCAALKAAEVAL